MGKHLRTLLFCLFVVMIGYGLTLTVLPFYIERLALARGATSQEASAQVGTLTGLFALMQFFFGPLWGKWSDRIGRRPLFIIGLGGNVVSNVLFGLGTNMTMLYGARILGGILSSAVITAATAYVADVTSEAERGKGLAWLGSATGLGVVVGPAFGAWLSRLESGFRYRFFSYFYVDDFSIPFFAAALLSFVTLVVALYRLSESLESAQESNGQSYHKQRTIEATSQGKTLWWLTDKSLREFLVISFLGQFALALFDGTFALHAQRVMKFGPTQLGLVFMVCGLVMAVAQAGLVGRLIDRFGEKPLLSIGSALMGIGLVLLMMTQTMIVILIYVGLFALGMAMFNPSVTALVTKNRGNRLGTALGLQNAVNSLGQAGGPFLGGILLGWYVHVPYLLAALPLIGVGIFAVKKGWLRKRPSQ
jgi:DHA1 family multidrug resistance protein-like MFS transporter